MDSGFNMLGQFQGDPSLGMEPSHQAQSPAFPSIRSNGVHISLVKFELNLPATRAEDLDEST